MKRCSSMFISKTKQHSHHQQIVNRTKLNPGLERVCYENKQGTIADEVRRKVDQVNNPLLASLTNKQNMKHAFSSNAPRFNQKILDEETYIGPGYYEQKSCFEKSRSSVATRAKTGAASQSTIGGQGVVTQTRSMQQIIA